MIDFLIFAPEYFLVFTKYGKIHNTVYGFHMFLLKIRLPTCWLVGRYILIIAKTFLRDKESTSLTTSNLTLVPYLGFWILCSDNLYLAVTILRQATYN